MDLIGCHGHDPDDIVTGRATWGRVVRSYECDVDGWFVDASLVNDLFTQLLGCL